MFFGKLVGSDQYGNKYYKSKNDERWVVYSANIEALKSLLNGTYGYTIQLTKYLIIILQSLIGKKTFRKPNGTRNSHKPVKIRKTNVKKIMKLGSKIFSILILEDFDWNIVEQK